jgi:hypothetical protein
LNRKGHLIILQSVMMAWLFWYVKCCVWVHWSARKLRGTLTIEDSCGVGWHKEGYTSRLAEFLSVENRV